MAANKTKIKRTKRKLEKGQSLCPLLQMASSTDEDCWTLDKNKNKRPKAPPTERMFTALQMEQIAKALSAKAAKSKKKKRKVSFMSKVDDSSDNRTVR